MNSIGSRVVHRGPSLTILPNIKWTPRLETSLPKTRRAYSVRLSVYALGIVDSDAKQSLKPLRSSGGLYSTSTSLQRNVHTRHLSLWPFGSSQSPPSTSSNPELSAAQTPIEPVPVPQIDPATTLPPTDSLTDTVNLAAQTTYTTLEELGLGKGIFVGNAQKLLEFFHLTTGLPWYLTIAAFVITVRTLLFPVLRSVLINNARMANISPQFQKNLAKMKMASASGDRVEMQRLSTASQILLKENDCSPIRAFRLPLIQAPIFLILFLALKKMAEASMPGFLNGGALWFTDLNVPDPFYLLPAFSVAATIAVIRTNAESGPQAQTEASQKMKKIFTVVVCLCFPFMSYLPAAVLVYWVTQNSFSLLQALLLNVPSIRASVGIPLINQQALAEAAKISGGSKISFKEGVKFGAEIGQSEKTLTRDRNSLKTVSSDPFAKRTEPVRPLPSTSEISSPGLFGKVFNKLKPSGPGTAIVPSHDEPKLPPVDTVIPNRFKPRDPKEAKGVEDFRKQAQKHRKFILEEQERRQREADVLFKKTFDKVNTKGQSNNKKKEVSAQQSAAAQAIENSRRQSNTTKPPQAKMARNPGDVRGYATVNRGTAAQTSRDFETYMQAINQAGGPAAYDLKQRKLAWQKIQDRKQFLALGKAEAAKVENALKESAARQAVLEAGASQELADYVAAQIRLETLLEIGHTNATTSLERSSAQSAGRAVHDAGGTKLEIERAMKRAAHAAASQKVKSQRGQITKMRIVKGIFDTAPRPKGHPSINRHERRLLSRTYRRRARQEMKGTWKRILGWRVGDWDRSAANALTKERKWARGTLEAARANKLSRSPLTDGVSIRQV